MSHRASAALLIVAVVMSGCSTEAERYRRNLAGAQLCGYTRRLQPEDVDAIARAVAHATRKTIYAITTGDPKIALVNAEVCDEGALDDPGASSHSFGSYLMIRGDTPHFWSVLSHSPKVDPKLAKASQCKFLVQ